MNLRQLRYFVAVAEEGNIARAAVKLHISQPPLTRQIQLLEADIGTGLFIRSARGMQLTAAGELFLEEARHILALIVRATERTQRAGQGRLGRLDVAIFGSSILDVIPKLLLAFGNRYPDVKVVLHTMAKAEQIESLRQKRINVGFNRMLGPLEDIATRLVVTERLLLAVPAGHELAQRTTVPFGELRHHPIVLFPTGSKPSFMDKVVALCAKAGFEPDISQEVGDAVTGVALVASGYGVCLIPASATTLRIPGVVYREISDPPEGAQVDLTCIYRADDTSPILHGLLDIIDEFRQGLSAPTD